MWSKDRRRTHRKLIRNYAGPGLLLACVLAYTMHSNVSRDGYAVVIDRAESEAGLIVELTSGFVRAYSVYGARHPEAKLPNPAIFRASALSNVKQGIRDGGRFSTGVVGLLGKEIAQVAEEGSMRTLIQQLQATPSMVMASEVIEKNGQTTHRSLWAFVASEQACADCHNKVQNLTGDDQWQIGDLMGAQLVDQNIETPLAGVSHNALVQAVLLFIALIAAWLCCLYLINQLRLNKELKTLATTDPLTGCINRRELYDRIAQLKGRTNGAVLMLDLDKFKSINDTYGHDAGDEVIRDFSRSVQGALRKDDWVARFGGEEFVVWLPNVKPEEAIRIAERCRIAAEKAQVVVEGTSINYTVSIGLHIVQDATPTLFDNWMKTADEHLYLAKLAGRNRIVSESGTTS